MRTRLASIVALLAVAATALLSAGCGAGLDPVAQAATRTSDVSTLRFTLDMELRMAGDTVPITATGAVDTAARRLRVSMDMSKASALAGRGESLGRMTIVEDGLVMYMSSSVLGSLPGGRSWARIDLSRAAGALGVDLSSLTSGQTDPRTSLAQLREAGNVVKIGPDRVEGVQTTRYSVLLDLRKGLNRIDSGARELMEKLVDRLEASGGRYVPADVWIDGGGYLRRFRMQMSNYLGTGSSVSLTMSLFAFGDPVRIAVPEASRVADLTSLLSQSSGG